MSIPPGSGGTQGEKLLGALYVPEYTTRQSPAREGTVRSDIYAELYRSNKNVDEMIRLLQRAQDAGIWRELLRTKLNADFRELIALRRRVDLLGFSERNHRP
jgi:hypothetical protein